jgi:hypothetical protein
VIVISLYIDALETPKRTPCYGNHVTGPRD